MQSRNQKSNSDNFDRVVSFQAKVGRTSTYIQKIMAYIFGGLFMVGGLSLFFYGVYLSKKPKSKKSNNSYDPDNDSSLKNFKSKNFMIAGGVLFFLGLLTIVISVIVYKIAKKSKTAAAVLGTSAELGAIFNR